MGLRVAYARGMGSICIHGFSVIALLVSCATASRAELPAVYHSPADDGIRPTSVPTELAAPVVTLFLYIDAGGAASSNGTPCVDGEGDELCAWEFRIQATGAATIQDFTADPSQDVVFRIGADDLAATGGDAVAGELGPIRIGELDLDVLGSGWTARVVEGTAVDAGFGHVGLLESTIAVPEPRRVAQLVTGLLGLAGLGRARERRRRRRGRALRWMGISGGRRNLCVVLLAIGLIPAEAWAQDADGDGVLDETDNCVYTANPFQEDFGGLFGPPADGIGDACQCGDVNDDGQIDLLDVATYQRGLAGALPLALDEDKCSVVGGRLDCDPNDQQVLRETIVGLTPGVSQVCQSAKLVPPSPARITAAGDSITQGFAADCTCNAGFLGLICLLCPAGGDQPEHSWFDGSALDNSFYALYGGSGSGITSSRVSVSGAQMNGGADSFANQVDDILALVPIPDLVVVELGGNDVCNRDCVDPGSCGNPLYDDLTWSNAVEAGLEKLVGFDQATSLPPGSTVYLLGVPRVQDLYAAGVAKQQAANNIDCDSFRDDFDVCEIATLDAPLNGEDLPTRLAALATRIPRYNEILRDLALAYTTNSNGKNPNGIEVVTDYVNESLPSIGTTAFGPNEINGGDCFHPSVSGQAEISAAAWFSNPR